MKSLSYKKSEFPQNFNVRKIVKIASYQKVSKTPRHLVAIFKAKTILTLLKCWDILGHFQTLWPQLKKRLHLSNTKSHFYLRFNCAEEV